MGTAGQASDPLLDSGQPAVEERVPHWHEQITARGLAVSAVLGVLFSVITHKLSLTTGIIPSLNVAAGLLGFFLVKSWVAFFGKLGFSVKPFTRQENTVIQTCVVACYGIAASGGFSSYLLAMDQRTYELVGADYPGNRAEDVKNPGLGWIIVFLTTVSFVGIFSLVPLRKVMIMDYKLTYPSGTATAMLINSFHTNTGAELAGFYFDFSPTYVGCGLICPHIVSCSLLLGAIMSWGFLWPFISSRAGNWYPVGLDSNSFKGLSAYKVFIPTSLILGDGVYHIIKILATAIIGMCSQGSKTSEIPVRNGVLDAETSKFEVAQKKRDEIFTSEKIPTWFVVSGYVGLVAISTATIPVMFPPLKWYFVLASYAIAPALAFCNSYSCGLTDMGLGTTYGKIGLFVIASAVGSDSGGVIAGLVSSGLMLCIVSTAADLMQDMKTGYLTLSSAKSMFVSQLAGTAMGIVVAPLTFWLFWTAFDVGSPDGPYPAPYAVIFREMAILGVEGFSELPKHCIALCIGSFSVAFAVNLIRDVTPKRVSRFIPIPTAMAAPFFIGAYFAIDMFVGSVILFVWETLNEKGAEDYAGAVASGLICGDGIWLVPSAILSILRINPPICMTFGPSLSE